MGQKLKNRKKALRKWPLGEYVGHVIWIAWNIKAPRFYTKHVIEIIYLDRWQPYSPMRWFDIRSKMRPELKINWIEKFTGKKFHTETVRNFLKLSLHLMQETLFWKICTQQHCPQTYIIKSQVSPKHHDS